MLAILAGIRRLVNRGAAHAVGSFVALVFLWWGVVRSGGTPTGDGSRVIQFIEFARDAAHGFVFWNPFRNGGYPMLADPEHFWALSAITDPATGGGRLFFNILLLAAILIGAIPVWLIARRLGWSSGWAALAVLSLCFTERLVWSQESGRFSSILVHFDLLVIIWALLAEKLRRRHYVLLTLCLAFDIQTIVQVSVVAVLIIFAGLLARKRLNGLSTVRSLIASTLQLAALGTTAFFLSAVWTLPLLMEFRASHTGIAGLTYEPNLPGAFADYAGTILPFAPGNPEIISFASLVLVTALVAGSRSGLATEEKRLFWIGAPMYCWVLIWLAMSVPFIGTIVKAIYTSSPIIASVRWFAIPWDISTIFLTIGAIGLLRNAMMRESTLNRLQRAALALYFAASASTAFIFAREEHVLLACFVGTVLAIFSLYFVVTAWWPNAAQIFWRVELRALAGSVVAISALAILATRLDWERGPLYSVSAPVLPGLENVIRSDRDPYFRYIREDNANLWPLDQAQRGLRAFSAYFPPGLAYTFAYLSPQIDINQARPNWILLKCNQLNPRALDLIGAKYVFCGNDAPPEPGWIRIGDEHGQEISNLCLQGRWYVPRQCLNTEHISQTLFRRQGYNGGIRLFHEWRTEGSEAPEAARASVLDAASRNIGLVEGTTPSGAAARSPKDHDRIQLTLDAPGQMALTVTTERPAILFIPDNYDEGWTAWVNGAPRRALRIFHAYLGVRVDSGTSVVQFTYRDRYFPIGIAISLATLAALVIYLFFGGAGSDRSPHRDEERHA